MDYSKMSNSERLEMDMILYNTNCKDKDGNWIDVRKVRIGKDGLIYYSEDWKTEVNKKVIEATVTTHI